MEHLCDQDEGYSISIEKFSIYFSPKPLVLSLFQDYVVLSELWVSWTRRALDHTYTQGQTKVLKCTNFHGISLPLGRYFP